ncbi:peptidoglycan binding protein CsiV [Pseudomonas asplenii]|uniref:peptidoglycan binding protein CsiV n=1 Tax=Pseudomonas asplenii TaxID=53407 RepID=UPI0022345551|nr:peptidoglycan binding protein CsiV [Pseudomonas asplenii]UZE27436.1 peptidoglycan binding protein CsiV [Pseudomonas asplenii]
MRLIPSLAVLLALLAPTAFADEPYQVEMILVRQNLEQPFQSQPAPEDWAKGAKAVTVADERTPSLNDMVAKLEASGNYEVLLHKAWQQNLSDQPSIVSITAGNEQFGQFPVEGTLSLTLKRFTEVQAQFWVNRFDGNGVVNDSERLNQTSQTKNGQLNFLDSGHLALLLKVTSLNASKREAPSQNLDQ